MRTRDFNRGQFSRRMPERISGVRKFAKRLIGIAGKAAAIAALVVGASVASALPSFAKGVYSDSSAHAAAEPDILVLHVGKARVLDLPREAADVMISDPEIVGTVLRTASQPVFFGMRIGQANALFFDQENREVGSIEIRVEYDVAVLNQMIRRQFPNAMVNADSILGEVILTGQTRSSSEALAIVELSKRFVAASRASQSESGEVAEVEAEESGGVVDRVTILNEEQVHLKVQVAEVNRNVLKRLGLDWNAGLQSAALSSTIGVRSAGLKGFLAANPTTIAVGPQTLDSFLKALEQYNLVRTLAEPSLTAVSGEQASFLAGGEFPIPISRQDGETTIEFKSFGVSLDFTPVVLSEGRISLTVATEVSDLTDEGSVNIGGLLIPALSVRRADTTVEVNSGGTIMIAGLIQQTTRRLSAGLPGLRSLPVLGAFFRAEEHEIDETELVVLVTPYEVRPGKADGFRLPTDGFAPASDLDVYLFGRLHGVYGAETRPETEVRSDIADLNAPVGFMME